MLKNKQINECFTLLRPIVDWNLTQKSYKIHIVESYPDYLCPSQFKSGSVAGVQKLSEPHPSGERDQLHFNAFHLC